MIKTILKDLNKIKSKIDTLFDEDTKNKVRLNTIFLNNCGMPITVINNGEVDKEQSDIINKERSRVGMEAYKMMGNLKVDTQDQRAYENINRLMLDLLTQIKAYQRYKND